MRRSPHVARRERIDARPRCAGEKAAADITCPGALSRAVGQAHLRELWQRRACVRRKQAAAYHGGHE